MFSTANPCCYGSFYDVGCTIECPTRRADADAKAWAAYSRAWPEAMAGIQERFIGGSSLGRRTEVPLSNIDWAE